MDPSTLDKKIDSPDGALSFVLLFTDYDGTN